MLDLNELKSKSLYVHLFANGKLFVIPGDLPAGYSCDFAGFLLELEDCKYRQGVLYYSIEELPEIDSEGKVEKFLDAITNSGLETQMIHPHPQVYGYYKSFIPYLNDALEVAAIDVKGILESITRAEKELSEAEIGTQPYEELKLRITDLKEQYTQAYKALDKLADLHFELTAEDLKLVS